MISLTPARRNSDRRLIMSRKLTRKIKKERNPLVNKLSDGKYKIKTEILSHDKLTMQINKVANRQTKQKEGQEKGRRHNLLIKKNHRNCLCSSATQCYD